MRHTAPFLLLQLLSLALLCHCAAAAVKHDLNSDFTVNAAAAAAAGATSIDDTWIVHKKRRFGDIRNCFWDGDGPCPIDGSCVDGDGRRRTKIGEKIVDCWFLCLHRTQCKRTFCC